LGKNGQNEVRLALDIALDVARMLFCEPLLQTGIRGQILRMRADMVTKCDVVT